MKNFKNTKKIFLAIALTFLFVNYLSASDAIYNNEYIAPEIPSYSSYSDSYGAYGSYGYDDYGYSSSSRKKLPDMENKSTEAGKVIKSYFFMSDSEKSALIQRHKEIKKLKNKQNIFEAYAGLVYANQLDYFSAYMAGAAAKEMGDHERSINWLEYCLGVNPKYIPAKMMLKNEKVLHNYQPGGYGSESNY